MKFLTTSLVLALCAATLTAAPRLFVSTSKLGPSSEIELILDRAAVSDDLVGKQILATEWLTIKPALAARLAWKSPNVARLVLDEVPAIGATYQLFLTGRHQHLDGSPVPTGPVGALNSESLKIEYGTIRDRYSSGFSRRNAVHLIRFNDDVDPASAAAFFRFVDKQNHTVAARASRPDPADQSLRRYRQLSWSQSFQGKRNADAPAPAPGTGNLLLVSPANPLPIGKGWQLIARPGLPNATGNAVTRDSFNGWIGDVQPFELKEIATSVSVNQPRQIIVRFSSHLQKNIDPARFIQISPVPDDLSFKVDDSKVFITGKLRARDSWQVSVAPGIESKDGLPLAEGGKKSLKFENLHPRIAFPSRDGPQLASGSRNYRIATVNLASVQVRAKRISGSAMMRALQGYRHYTGDGPDNESLPKVDSLPWELIVGEPVIDLELPLDNPIDTLRMVQLDWNELLPADQRYATLFLEAVGTAKEGTRVDEPPLTQAIIQLTDIGVGWKIGPVDTVLYAFSCDTGEPLPGVWFKFFGEDAKPLANAASDDNGIARIPNNATARHLVARLGDDSFAAAFDRALPTVGMWHFPVRYSWREPQLRQRKAFLFTDRSLYRPGETVHLKGIVRTRDGNAITPHEAGATRLLVFDPADREILRVPIALSEHGSFDHSLRLPAETVGTFEFRFEYGDDIERAEQIEDDWSARWQALNNARFRIQVPVAEFRRNAFELAHELETPAPGADEVSLALNANYYQGQPVAAGKVQAWTRISDTNFYPERYRDYLFGDHRSYDPWYWAHYFGYSDDSYHSSRSNTETEELELDDSGKVTISSRLPETKDPSTRAIRISTEVTDPNHQSLTESSETVVHPASVYAGVGRLDRLVRVGDQLTVPVVATTHEGKPFEQPLEVAITVTREINEQVKIAGENGRTSVRNEKREVPVSTASLTLDPAANQGRGTPLSFAPADSGRHLIAISGSDPDGRPFLTRTQVHVYGSDDYPWAYEDGIKIKLVAEKRSYKPGETARILVLSPIEGSALVTIEREGVLRSFNTRLTATEPVIEIPLTDADAPNAYVSVLVVKGARDSARKFPEPQLRLGYCELTVENVRDHLAIELNPGTSGTGVSPVGTNPAEGRSDPPEYLPGDTVTLTGTVSNADGTPAANAEVTVWAEDEGVLAVMGYDNPAPMKFFYDPREIMIRSGTSLSMLLPESPDEQEFFNKGFWVGGGGWDESMAERMRRDFRPCAVWAPALVTDPQGAFTVSFTAPDTLTRYRVLAVASHGSARFGSAESAITVNRPLMLQPKPPRFALEGDHTVLPVTIQNASDYSGEWKLTLNRNGTALVDETVSLEAGKSETLRHTVAFDRSGDSVFQWIATPVSLRGRQLNPAITRRLSDAVEHEIPVDYPMPLLRAHRLISLNNDAAPRDLLDGIDPALRDGRGSVGLEFADSLLMEAGGAVDYLLRYPYGCVEQTTSSMMPWFAVKSLRPVVPSFAKIPDEKVDKAIRKGVERLLMMQLPSGGFRYWPGNGQRVDWATSYAGLGLVLAREAGAEVPDMAIDALCNDLARSMRGLDEAKGSRALESAARSLWVLALAGKPETAYRNHLLERLPELDRANRCLLALAIAAEGDNSSRSLAAGVMEDAVTFRGNQDRWMRWHPDHALELLARTTIAPGSDESIEALDRLIRDRSPYGHWRTTWVNAWALLGMAAYAEHQPRDNQSVVVTVNTPDGPRNVTLNDDSRSAALKLPLEPGITLTANADGPAYVRVKVAAKPAVAPQQPVARNGLEITRTWERVHPDGTREALDRPQPGDLILTSLRIKLPSDGSRYLVVEDRLPAIFETVDDSSRSQGAAHASTQANWRVSHRELRDDRAVFFFDHVPHSGTYTVQYLARCTLAGDATAPPAKVESMYDPENYALSASRRFTTK